jgi:FHA domain-containing protein
MALPDPQRHVSRQQAEIALQGASFIIRNVGAANPIVVGTRAVGPGETAVLGQDEQIRIGGYLLKALMNAAPPVAERLTPRPTPRPATPVPGQAAVAPAMPARAAAPTDPFADLLGTPAPAPVAPLATFAPPPVAAVPASNPFADLLGSPAPAAPTPMFAKAHTPNDPFADLLGSPVPAPSPAAYSPAPASSDPFADLLPPPSGVHASSVALAPPAPAAMKLPDDFDPFAAPAAPRLPPKAQVDPFADLMPAASAGPSIDAMFDLGAASDADPLASFMSPATPAAGAGAAIDPLAMFGAPAAAPAAGLPQADNVSALHGAFQLPIAPPAAPAAALPDLDFAIGAPAPAAAASATLGTFTKPSPMPVAAMPPPQAPMPAAAPATRPQTPTATSGDAAALWWAFCEGAGITPTVPSGPLDQHMREMGLILRRAVEGTLQLIAVRASTKHELRAGVTVIQQANNNPLKFSPDAKAGLEQMMQPPMRGFLSGPAAMQDAMHDLVGHSIGTVAGMRAAVEGMLDRFAPQALESKLVGGGMFDSVLPGHRKAKLWDMYTQQHGAIREEAQEDFHNLFGKAFLAAYEQQVERLKQEASQP